MVASVLDPVDHEDVVGARTPAIESTTKIERVFKPFMGPEARFDFHDVGSTS